MAPLPAYGTKPNLADFGQTLNRDLWIDKNRNKVVVGGELEHPALDFRWAATALPAWGRLLHPPRLNQGILSALRHTPFPRRLALIVKINQIADLCELE